MIRLVSVLAILALAACQSSTGSQAAEIHQTTAGPVKVSAVVGDLDQPWAVAFLPDRRLLVTERGGRLLLADRDGGRKAITGVPEVFARGQGGLLDVVVARDFDTSGEIFLSYAARYDGGAGTALAVARLDADGARLQDLRVIFRQSGPTGSRHHFGSRIVEHADGTLFLTIGDRGAADQAQDTGAHNGKVLWLNRDGSPAAGQPISPGAAPEIWSYGHRNPQGAALDETGALWTVEHGAMGGDEVNRPERGANHGWPVISYGRQYSGAKIGVGVSASGMTQPLHYWDPSIAPSGMMIYSGRLWPEWRGDIFVGSLKFDHIARLDRDGDVISDEEKLLTDVFGRIRDVREGPDGAIWFLSVNDDTLYRIDPVN